MQQLLKQVWIGLIYQFANLIGHSLYPLRKITIILLIFSYNFSYNSDHPKL